MGKDEKIHLDSRLRGNDIMGGRPEGNDAETGRKGEAESSVRCQWSVARCKKSIEHPSTRPVDELRSSRSGQVGHRA
jgi:hypothetical protein